MGDGDRAPTPAPRLAAPAPAAVAKPRPPPPPPPAFLCGDEAAALLNCVAAKDYAPEKCAALVEKLRSCVRRNVSGAARRLLPPSARISGNSHRPLRLVPCARSAS
jgi:hypothetical protein